MLFTKMHGIGNDYVYVNCFKETIENPAQLAPIISDRHKGIGADGLILISASNKPKTEVRMRIFNADGSEAEMCGNGVRCVAKYSYERGLAKPKDPFVIARQEQCPVSVNIETGNGVLSVGLITDDNDKVQEVCVNMGQPMLEAKQIPINLPIQNVIEQPMQFENRAFKMTCVSMGNPHAVFFRDNIDGFNLQKFGPVIENHSIFPQRTNVHFVEVLNRNEFRMRTWERGSGITLACGTGASACCVAAVLTDRCDRTCTAHLPGGDLDLYWCKEDNCLYMTGPATEVFEGIWPD
ncbi:MAG: diaminopimelate epimerase [Planctomycetota bacterium]|jgi:diaminopimelate epimerase